MNNSIQLLSLLFTVDVSALEPRSQNNHPFLFPNISRNPFSFRDSVNEVMVDDSFKTQKKTEDTKKIENSSTIEKSQLTNEQQAIKDIDIITDVEKVYNEKIEDCKSIKDTIKKKINIENLKIDLQRIKKKLLNNKFFNKANKQPVANEAKDIVGVNENTVVVSEVDPKNAVENNKNGFFGKIKNLFKKNKNNGNEKQTQTTASDNLDLQEGVKLLDTLSNENKTEFGSNSIYKQDAQGIQSENHMARFNNKNDTENISKLKRMGAIRTKNSKEQNDSQITNSLAAIGDLNDEIDKDNKDSEERYQLKRMGAIRRRNSQNKNDSQITNSLAAIGDLNDEIDKDNKDSKERYQLKRMGAIRRRNSQNKNDSQITNSLAAIRDLNDEIDKDNKDSEEKYQFKRMGAIRRRNSKEQKDSTDNNSLEAKEDLPQGRPISLEINNFKDTEKMVEDEKTSQERRNSLQGSNSSLDITEELEKENVSLISGTPITRSQSAQTEDKAKEYTKTKPKGFFCRFFCFLKNVLHL